jgi:hypothetical protein
MGKQQEQTGNGFAIAGLATAFIGIFLLGGVMGIATLIFGGLALKGSPWAKVLGFVEIVVGIIFILVILMAASIR